MDHADRNRQVLMAFDFRKEEFVLEEVGVGKVEFNLLSLVHDRILTPYVDPLVCGWQQGHCSLLEM